MSLDGRTAVRERNAVAILDAALEALRANPDAGMGEIATAAGVGRATLYRHYETRDDLLEALHARVRTEFTGLLGSLVAQPAGLERFVTDLFELRAGWAGIAPQRQRDEVRIREMWLPMLDVIRELQDAGTLDPVLAPNWVLATFRGQLRAAAEEIDAGRLLRADAAPLVVRAFLRGVS